MKFLNAGPLGPLHTELIVNDGMCAYYDMYGRETKETPGVMLKIAPSTTIVLNMGQVEHLLAYLSDVHSKYAPTIAKTIVKMVEP